MTLERTLPSDYYTAPSLFALECDRIFRRDWICVGRDSQLAAPGDHLVIDAAGESIILLRNQAGLLRAFYNVCRHRGAQLCGTALPGGARTGGVIDGKYLRCPYHSWVYDLDGGLIAAPFLSAEDADPAEFALYPVGIESWGGFIFIHLTPEAATPLATLLGAMPDRLVRYPLDQLQIGRTIRYDVQANWKILAENYNECYHCAGVHPELCAIVPAFRTQGGSDLDWERGVPHRPGAYTFTGSGTTRRAPFPGLNEDEQTRHKGELVYPNFFLSLSCDHAAAFILHPMAPDRTIIDCLFLFAADEITKPDFDPSDAVEFWDLVNRQDWAICESVQRGMQAGPHRHGYYAPMEDWTLDIRRYIERKLGLVP
jgi:Rieske 2Fe-2S family protein